MALFAKGNPGGPGRPKGPVHPVKTIRASLHEANFDLGKELLLLLHHTEASIDQKLAVLKVLAQYTQVAPKEEQAPLEEKPDLKAVGSDQLAKGLKG